jgi:hypothetical protein
MAKTRFAIEQTATKVLEKERLPGSSLRSFYHSGGHAFAQFLPFTMFPHSRLGCMASPEQSEPSEAASSPKRCDSPCSRLELIFRSVW